MIAKLGVYGFANPWESIFIPRGFAPWDENDSRGFAKTIASRLAITQNYILQITIAIVGDKKNKEIKEKGKNLQYITK